MAYTLELIILIDRFCMPLRRERYVINLSRIPFIANIIACLIKPVTESFINIVRYQMTYMQQILQSLYHKISVSYVL